MDTKSKNSKRFSFIVAGILVELAVFIYMAYYPFFQKRIHEYFSVSITNERLLEQIYQSNLVLYKDMYERVGGKTGSFAELYMTVQEEEIQGDIDYYTEGDKREVLENISDIFNRRMEEWQGEMLDGLFKGMDYYVIDHETGQSLQNTGRNIEKLYDGTMQEEEDPYVYYIKISYDKIGNISNISVRDTNPDELLKNVQSVMSRKLLENTMHTYMNFSNWDEYYFYEGINKSTKLNIKIDEKPKDVTFIYALTEDQKEMIESDSGFIVGDAWNQRYAYYEMGAGNLYVIILLVLAAVALLITRIKKYCLHHLTGFHMHLEVSVAMLICMLCLTVVAVDMAWSTNSGVFSEFYREYMEFLKSAYYPAVTRVYNILVLTVLFGGWYYGVTTFGEIFDLGIIGFIKERSLIVQFVSGTVKRIKRERNKWREELLHTDLSENTNSMLRHLIFINFCIVAVAAFMWMFGLIVLVPYSILLYVYGRKYIRKIQEQYHKALAATVSIAEGNLDTVLNEDFGMFEAYRNELNKIQDGFRKAVDEEVKSQRMKTELITNVSHDLKTPLTAITTYIELMEDENVTPEQQKEYLAVLKKKSLRLKFLIEDLFEVSKANSGNVSLNLLEVDICNLMRQVYLEYEDKIEEADLIFRFNLPDEKVILKLDSQKTYRVFENLYGNIIKYAMPHTRVYVNGVRTDKGIKIELKNMSATELNIPAEELTERFVRGDSARNTEGSGLGLAIARSFVELQGGKLMVEIDGDLFKVMMTFE